MDPNAFKYILESISNHKQFHNISTTLQMPILLQLMVSLYCFGRRAMMVCNVSNQFGTSEGVVYVFIFGLFWYFAP